MKNFELWLNESGQDIGTKTSRTGIKPSLVAGVLVDKDAPAIDLAQWLTNEYKPFDTYDQHENERLIELVEGLEASGAKYVLFSKGECLSATDENHTYISLLASGIEHFLRQLEQSYGEVYLKIILANRFDGWSEDQAENSTVLRLKECLMRAFHGSKLVECWRIVSANTQADLRLMAAEAVCVALLRRNARRFRSIQGAQTATLSERIQKCYKRAIILPVSEVALNLQFEADLLEGRIGAAILVASRDTTGHVSEFYQRIVDTLKHDASAHLSLQYDAVSLRLSHMIMEAKSFAAARQILENLEQVFIPLLKQTATELPETVRNLIPNIEFDVAKTMVTLFAQSKNIHACGQAIQKAEGLMQPMWQDWSLLFEVVDYRLQKALAYIRMMYYAEALAETELLIKGLEVLVGAEFPSGFLPTPQVASGQLNEAYALRFLTYVFLSKLDSKVCLNATTEYQQAENIKFSKFDQKRLARYRALFETNCSRYDEAWQFLYQSIDAQYMAKCNANKAEQLEAICAYIKVAQDGALLEALMHYVAALVANSDADGDKFYRQLQKNGTLTRFYTNFEDVDENWQLTIWREAFILMRLNEVERATERYRQVVNSCFATKNLHNDILHFIGVGAILDEMIELIRRGASSDDIEIQQKLAKLNRCLKEIKAAYGQEVIPASIANLLEIGEDITLELLIRKAALLPY